MKCILVAVLAVWTLITSVHCDSHTAWCYHQPSCNDSTWPDIAPTYCNGTRQSPINIVSTSARPDSNLTPFKFRNFRSRSTLKKIKNTGSTVKVTFGSGVRVSGGDLSEPYDCIEFHLHWGNGSSVPGSEHTVDGKRYAMELHIVCSKSSYNGDIALATEDPTGIAVLGFFIEEMSGQEIGQPVSWGTLTSYLAMIINSGESEAVEPGISLNDLLDGVDRKKYYRYLGSLTTPSCNEAVVWTVFKNSIKVSKDLIDLFSTTVQFSDSSFMTHVYRSIQPPQEVTTQPASSSSTTCYSVGLMVLSLVLGRS